MSLMNWNCRSIRKKVRQLARGHRLASLSRRKPSVASAAAAREELLTSTLLSENPNLKLDYEGIRFCDELKL